VVRANLRSLVEVGLPPRAGWEARYWSPIIEDPRHLVTTNASHGDMNSTPPRLSYGLTRSIACNLTTNMDKSVGGVTYTLMLG